jgi:hypothetical protein
MCNDPYEYELDERIYCAECNAVVADDFDCGPRCEACSGQLCDRCVDKGIVICEACDAERTAEMSFEEIGEIPALQQIAARPVTFYTGNETDMSLEGKENE